MDRVFLNIDRYGNTSAASVPLALAEAVEAGRVKQGDRVVMVAFGAGGTSGAVALKWTADPANGKRAEAVRPQDVHILEPDIEPMNPFPRELAWLLDKPGAGDVRPSGAGRTNTESVNPDAQSGAAVPPA